VLMTLVFRGAETETARWLGSSRAVDGKEFGGRNRSARWQHS
jgi:hypothetical protein